MAAKVVWPLCSHLLPPSVWLGGGHSGWASHLPQLLFGLVERVDYPVKFCYGGIGDFQELLPEFVVLDPRHVDDTEEVRRLHFLDGGVVRKKRRLMPKLS